ncbi:MAG TPA: ATP-binding protein [Solirubrobacteraceae bacterium]|jgi:anti-sigma regulatory factor (Ser/Thr protein kinase)|nr:ATP-binding protein [Solirubrobacteraceae bacterium]
MGAHLQQVVSHHDAPIGLPASELHLPARPAKLGAARQYAHEVAAAFGFDSDRCYEIAFAVNEAATNAIRHGKPDEHGCIHLSALADGDRLTLAVRDCGTFVACAGATDALAESGRGFALMERLMDAVQLCVSCGSTTVRLSKARA